MQYRALNAIDPVCDTFAYSGGRYNALFACASGWSDSTTSINPGLLALAPLRISLSISLHGTLGFWFQGHSSIDLGSGQLSGQVDMRLAERSLMWWICASRGSIRHMVDTHMKVTVFSTKQ